MASEPIKNAFRFVFMHGPNVLQEQLIEAQHDGDIPLVVYIGGAVFAFEKLTFSQGEWGARFQITRPMMLPPAPDITRLVAQISNEGQQT